MKENPILFSTDMVKAILDGRKTQTRRVIKSVDSSKLLGCDFSEGWLNVSVNQVKCALPKACPYGQVGDKLWVRETWASQHKYDHLPPRLIPHDANIHYAASGNLGGLMHRPSIFLPRWASRLTLEITDIRTQRLQEITHEDITAEGLGDGYTDIGWNYAYGQLWNKLNEKRGYGWSTNPWVWAITFKKLLEN